jgi:hypothetical protein
MVLLLVWSLAYTGVEGLTVGYASAEDEMD